MKKLHSIFAFICLSLGFAVSAHAQNLATVTALNIQDINGAKLAAGQLCFQARGRSADAGTKTFISLGHQDGHTNHKLAQ